MSTTLNNQQLLQLRDTNVSKPSILHRSRSEQSITASESYYSLSSSSGTVPANQQSQHTIQRFTTPPSRYRTPLQSRDNLPTTNEPTTALRGTGQRRHSLENEESPTRVRDHNNPFRRKPVPSIVVEDQQESAIQPGMARSSVAMDIARGQNAPSPDVDDTPFIHFALDQLTRDEEVLGSRPYAGPAQDFRNQPAKQGDIQTPAPVAVPIAKQERALPQQAVVNNAPIPPRNPNRPVSAVYTAEPHQTQAADVFLPLAASKARPLNFIPGILRTSRLALFLLVLLAYIALLLLAAIYSLAHTGVWDYGTIGDGRYFVFQYLPIMLGMILLLWLFQIQIALTRIAPFIALSSATPRVRSSGINLPIYLGDLLLPKLRYFRARLFVIGFFMLTAWLQLFTIPLLASAFNVYFVGSPNTGNWRWTAVQGIVWAIFTLYIILFLAVVLLVVYLARLEETGLRWDPRSFADVIVMLERSNGLDADHLTRNDPARLGWWRTSNRPNDAFHALGHANAEPRRYGVEGGRIREKHTSRDSTDLEANRWRHSGDAILEDSVSRSVALAYPWYLRISSVLLWIVIAIVLLLAFLIVSYLPSTQVINGFAPSLPVVVGPLGFGADNFLFSFISTVLAMLCLLFWISIDYTLRRFAPVESLLKPEGDLAERNLLLSYTADFPLHVSAAAAANGHWRLAWISFNTLIAAVLPVLAGGVFWAQFDVPTQVVRVYAHTTGFYALTALLVIYALSYILIFPFTRIQRDLAHGRGNKVQSLADLIALLRNSKVLDDFAFHGPLSKVDLVTRLLSIQPGAKVERRISTIPEASHSMLSLADSIRGFGNARQRAIGGTSVSGVPKYGLNNWTGRDGQEHFGIDRFR